MTIYYKLMFSLLTTEMLALTALVSPLPHNVRRTIARLRTNTGPVISSIAYSIKIALIVDLVFFVDAVNRLRMLTAEQEKATAANPGQMHDIATETSYRARKSYAQRNIYLTGFALFLSFILIRVFNLVAAWTDAEDRAVEYEAAGRNAAKHQADLIASERNFDAKQKEMKQKAALDKLAASAEAQ